MSSGSVSGFDGKLIERIAALYPADYDAEVFCHTFRDPFRSRGYLTPDELVRIVAWKSPRQKTNARNNNDDATVAAVTRQAFACPEPWLAAWTLCYLKAVWVRVASAILTIYDPDRYTVMDEWAWTALEQLGLLKPLGLSTYGGMDKVDLDSCETYAAYLGACRQLADEAGVSLRTLDRCLWTVGKFGTAGLAQRGITLPTATLAPER